MEGHRMEADPWSGGAVTLNLGLLIKAAGEIKEK